MELVSAVRGLFSALGVRTGTALVGFTRWTVGAVIVGLKVVLRSDLRADLRAIVGLKSGALVRAVVPT